MVCVHHSTFLINSAAHYFGGRPFSTEHTARDNIWTAFLTFGEGYHNYHHEFPHDYRNGVRKFQWDPSKWVIRLCSFLGLASSLRKFPREEWRKARLQVKEEAIGNLAPDSLAIQKGKIEKQKAKFDWGPNPQELPEWTHKDIEAKIAEGKHLVIYDDVVHDVDLSDWINNHPGGSQILEFWNGRDATTAMNGETYRHTKAARNILAKLRVARYKEDHQIEHRDSSVTDPVSFAGVLQNLGITEQKPSKTEETTRLRSQKRKVRSLSPAAKSVRQ